MPPNASASTDAPKEPAGNTPDSAPLQTESDGSAPVRFVPAPYAASTYPPRRLATEVQALRAVLKPLPSAPPPRDALS